MRARMLAAKFAAYSWYKEVRRGEQTPDEAGVFAQENWQAFVPVVPEGLGRLLRKIARTRRRARAFALAEC